MQTWRILKFYEPSKNNKNIFVTGFAEGEEKNNIAQKHLKE